MVVEKDEKRYEYVVNTLNVGVLHANGASPHVLQGVLDGDIDFFLAVTESDEVNIFACLVAKKMFPNLRTVARMRDQDYTEGGRVSNFLNVDHVISPEYLVATKMKKIALLENAIDHEAIPAYGLEVAKFRFSHDRHDIANVPLFQLPVPGGCKILCIHRNGDAFIPLEGDALRIGDEVIVIGKEDDIIKFDHFLGSVKLPRDVLIIGGGIVAEYLICMLEKESISVRLIEKNESRCKELAQKFNRAIIINDNGSDPLVLRNENVGMTDVLVCATNNEEGDLLACLVGKHLGVTKTITSFSKQEYKDIFQMVGIDSAVSYYEVVANEIIKQTVPEHEVLLLMEGFKNELISLMVGPRCRINGKSVEEIELPERSIIAMVITDDGPILPARDMVIKEGDALLIYADKMDVSVLERIFKLDIPVNP